MNFHMVLLKVLLSLTIIEAAEFFKRSLSDANPRDEFDNKHYPSVGEAALCGLYCQMNSCNMFVLHNEQCWLVKLVSI